MEKLKFLGERNDDGVNGDTKGLANKKVNAEMFKTEITQLLTSINTILQ